MIIGWRIGIRAELQAWDDGTNVIKFDLLDTLTEVDIDNVRRDQGVETGEVLGGLAEH